MSAQETPAERMLRVAESCFGGCECTQAGHEIIISALRKHRAENTKYLDAVAGTEYDEAIDECARHCEAQNARIDTAIVAIAQATGSQA